MPGKKSVYRTLFFAFIGLGGIFLLYGTVQVVSAAMPETGTPEQEIHLRIVQHRWQWDPDFVEVLQGARVRVHIENEDSIDHGFAIREFGVDRRVPADSTVTVDFVADRAGEFEFFCSVYCGAGHFDQKGTLVVLGSGEVPAERPPAADFDLPVRSRQDAVARLEPRIEDEVKVFELTVAEIMWDYGGGHVVRSWGYNGQLPGPEIRVTEGEAVRIIVTNELSVATTVHWHGLDVPNEMDGVPGYTQQPIGPGETFVYEFTAYPAGTRFYHTHGSHHGDEAEQMDMGLAGAFVIEPRDFDPPDVDATLVLTERIRSGIFPINGAIYPHIDPIMVEEGDRVRIRMINAGSSTFHPMHLHGHQFRVVAVDGNPIPEAAQLTRNNLPVLPGETFDVEFIADNPGIWLLHCHELQHAAGGMITTVQYHGYEPPDAGSHDSGASHDSDSHG
jgi:manganese oxidase